MHPETGQFTGGLLKNEEYPAPISTDVPPWLYGIKWVAANEVSVKALEQSNGYAIMVSFFLKMWFLLGYECWSSIPHVMQNGTLYPALFVSVAVIWKGYVDENATFVYGSRVFVQY